MRLGADADALDAFAELLSRSSAQLAANVAGLDGEVHAASWTGDDAARFRDGWRRQVPGLRAVSERLGDAASDCRRNAAEQRRTSADLAPNGGGTVASGGHGDRAAGFAPLPAPQRVRLLEVDVEGGLGVVGAAGVSLRVEDLAGGRVRVTESLRAGAGLGVSGGAGASARVDGTEVGIGGTAGISVLAGVGTHRSWEVPADDLDGLVASLALEAAGPGALTVGVLPGLDDVSGLLGHLPGLGWLPDAVPAPRRVGASVGVGGSASAGVEAGARGGVGSTSAGAVTVVSDRRTGEVVLQLDGEVAAEVFAAAGLPGADRGAGRSLRSSVAVTLDGDGGPVRLELSSATDDGQDVHERVVAVDLTDPAVADTAATLARRLERGDTGSLDPLLARLAVHGVAVQRDWVHVADRPAFELDLGVGSLDVQVTELRARR